MLGFLIIRQIIGHYFANMEIIRRYYNALCENRKNGENEASHAVEKLKLIMQNAGLDITDRTVADAANKKAADTG